MAKLILQPCAGRAARKHFDKTIANPVNLNVFTSLLGQQLDSVSNLYPIEAARVWGVTPGQTGGNIRKYERAELGDAVLFTGENKAYAGGILVAKLHSAEVAAQLWEVDEHGLTWEHMYLLGDVWPLDIPYTALRAALGYDAGYPFMGFNVVDLDRSERALSALGPGRLPFLSGNAFGTRSKPNPAFPESSPLGTTYISANEDVELGHTQPFDVDPDVVDRGLRGHAETQNALAAYLVEKGRIPWKPTDITPNYDIAWERDGVLFVAEIKSSTPVNETRQLRLALGQVLDYADQLSRPGTVVRPVIAMEHELEGERWVDLCLRHGVTLVWPGQFDRLG